MTLDRAYYLLAAFYSLIVIIGVIAILAGGGTLLAPIHLMLGALSVIGLWGYILKRGFMNPRMWRPLAGVLGGGYRDSNVHHADNGAFERFINLDADQQYFFGHAGDYALPLW
ncbi:hypothetical protein [Halomonas sp. PA16-9]|uniref:hypothetical protein n=1 Tax=Halomonas sp. PA16-9 TaxID=2576841 RepID=UPI0030EE8E0C